MHRFVHLLYKYSNFLPLYQMLSLLFSFDHGTCSEIKVKRSADMYNTGAEVALSVRI